MASPAYSMTWPVPPAVPISPMMARMMSLAVTPSGSLPSTVTRMFLAFFCVSVCVASTCSTSEVPMPMRQRPEGAVRGRVAVAADDGGAGQREALLGADHVHDALTHVELVVVLDAEILGVPGQRLHLEAALRRRRSRRGDRRSARCGRRRPASSRARAPFGPPDADPRTPAGSSPRARDAGRCRECRCRRAAWPRRDRRKSCRRVPWDVLGRGAGHARGSFQPNVSLFKRGRFCARRYCPARPRVYDGNCALRTGWRRIRSSMRARSRLKSARSLPFSWRSFGTGMVRGLTWL